MAGPVAIVLFGQNIYSASLTAYVTCLTYGLACSYFVSVSYVHS